jgi:PIN domain nuclease of toxin-antitoxin system
MNCLVDTQILLWSFFDPSKLSLKITQHLSDENNRIYYIPVNFWEISIKYGLGKLELNGFTPEELLTEVESSFYACKKIDTFTMATTHKLPYLHKDPFDRILIWESIHNDLVFLSLDDSIKRYTQYGLKLVF